MVKKIIKTNPNLIELINKLNKKSKSEDAAIWKDVAQRLERSNRRTAEVNLSDIARHAEAGETILVPGKVLSNGDLTEKVDVVALKFSAKAQEKIENNVNFNPESVSKNAQIVYNILSDGVNELDEITRSSCFEVRKVLTALVELEMVGAVKMTAPNRYEINS